MATVGVSGSEEKISPTNGHPNGKTMRRPRPAEEESSADARFFLSKTETNGSTLELGREFSTEGEARVEALKAGLTYYSVQEWRPVANFAGKNPELKREPVTRKAGSNGTE